MFISCLASKLFTTYSILCLFNYPISICNKAVQICITMPSFIDLSLTFAKNLNKGSLHTKHFKLGLQYTELKCHTLNTTLLSRISRLYILSDGFIPFDVIFFRRSVFWRYFFRHSVFRCSVFWHYFFRRSLCFDV